jgi:hypothetical protein
VAAFAGDRRLKTRNTVYHLRDGICVRARPRDHGHSSARRDAAFVGMRLVGWVPRREPLAGIHGEWTLGAYAVLWRLGKPGERGPAIAMTSTTLSFEGVVDRPKMPRRLLVIRRDPSLARIGSPTGGREE